MRLIDLQAAAEAQKYGKTKPPSSSASIDSYSYWFEQAYPHPENRQQFLRELMEKAFMSRANFRLAHLLLDSTVTNLVVTPNFDDFLSRALTLFGRSHIVCDHPRTLERIDLRLEDVQIIHIHGSYRFYDCCNLRAEIVERAKGSASTSFTMLSVLDDILRTRSPLVVGYSGWDGDVFMDALRRRLSAPLRTNLYWFCYKRRDAEGLPDWLKECPNFCAVVPDEAKPVERGTAESASSSVLTTVGESAAGPLKSEAYATSGAGFNELTQAASAVFDELIRGFNLGVPLLASDPVGFLSKQLRDSLLGDKPEELASDVYAIRAVVERLERLKQLEAEHPLRSKSVSLLEAFRNAVRQSQNREAIRLAGQIPLTDLTPEQLREVSSLLVDAGSALSDNSDEEFRFCDVTVEIADRLDALGQSDRSTSDRAARALFNKGIALGNLDRSEEEIAVYGEVVRRFGDAYEPGVREQVAKALFNKGVTLGSLDRSEEAIAVYDELVRRFGDAAEPALRVPVAMALVSRGFRLGELNRREEEVPVYDEVLRRFGNAAEPALRERVAIALVNKGTTLRALNRSEEEIAVYDEVVRRFGDAPEPPIRELVATAAARKQSIADRSGG